MPIYEFYCQDCHTIYNFFSSRINTEKRPDCPRCGRKQLEKQVSLFSHIGKAREPTGNEMFAGLDETRLESAFGELMSRAENLNEDDPKQMADIMRQLSQKAGLSLGEGMEEALSRLEAGEDPEAIEREMGDVLEDESQLFAALKKKGAKRRSAEPSRDDTLYEL